MERESRFVRGYEVPHRDIEVKEVGSVLRKLERLLEDENIDLDLIHIETNSQFYKQVSELEESFIAEAIANYLEIIPQLNQEEILDFLLGKLIDSDDVGEIQRSQAPMYLIHRARGIRDERENRERGG